MKRTLILGSGLALLAGLAAAQQGTNGTGEQNQKVSSTTFTGTGKQIYVQACQSCHMAQGQGARGAGNYPKMVGNPKLASREYVEFMVMNGKGGMPGFGRYLNDQQMSDVVNYVRTEMNKYPGRVTPADIRFIRPADPDYTVFGEGAG